MSLVESMGGYYDKDGNWIRTKFCFAYCGEACNCMPPLQPRGPNMKAPFPFLPHQLAWIEDLKTTTEPQTRVYLFRKIARSPEDKRGFCCLGRICVLENVPDSQVKDQVAKFNGSSTLLPPDLVAKYKLRSGLGGFKHSVEGNNDQRYVDLADMNDSGKYTFKQIAEYIEQNPENVFTNLDLSMSYSISTP